MRMSRIVAALVLTTASPVLLPSSADAQFGLYTLPQNDFRWNWGQTVAEGQARGLPDLEVSGSESFFQCELTAKLRPLSMTLEETRAIENTLRARLDFVYGVSETMNALDQQRYLDWAVLDCKKHEADPATAEQSAEREAEAREKMLRELERRRARQNKAE